MSKKKKWYQMGKFEGGHPFGDVFRTVKNAVRRNKKVNKKKNTQDKTIKKAQTNKKTNSESIAFGAVKNGRLVFDPSAQLYGFADEDERQDYIKKNPDLYAAMGGYKYEPQVASVNYTPLTKEGESVVQKTQAKDDYINSLQYKADVINARNAEIKCSNAQLLTDGEIEAETRLKWLRGELNSSEITAQIKKNKDIHNAKTKFDKGEDISLDERLLLIENGGENYTGGDTYKTIDFLAVDNSKNLELRDAAEKARQKERKGIELTKGEKADIFNYETLRHIQKSIVRDKFSMGNNIKQNSENVNSIAATSLYNDAIYDTKINKTFAQMQLYTNTGFTKFFQDTINAANIFLTEKAYRNGLRDNRASDVLKNIPKSKYEIANNAVGEYFTRNNMKFSKFVQDTTVSLANNAIPMLLAGVSGGASMAATGLSVFGGSYSEAVEMAPDAEEWRYWLYAGVNTSVELCMEKLLSGDKNISKNTGSEFTDTMLKSLTKNISNKLLFKGAYVISNGTGEFIEETIQGLLSPIIQESILEVDTTSILSLNNNEQFNAIKNALYDGFVGFASACVTTGILGKDAIDNMYQKQMVGAYYNKVFDNLNIDVKNVATYLKQISNEKNLDLYKTAEAVLKGDRSDSTVADMMIHGLERSREAQSFVYTKIGEQLNQNNKYTIHRLIRQYDILAQNGIQFSESITDTYNGLVDADEDISRDRFNYLVGRLSATMDAVVPRASVAKELVKKINSNIEEKGSTNNDNTRINEDEVIAGMWEDAESTKNSQNNNAENVEKSQLESVENFDESGIIKKAREYLKSPEGQKDKRPYLRHRPSYAKNQIEMVFNSNKNEFGKVYDPTGVEILWDLSRQRNGQWDMGHIPGQKYSVVHAKYVLGMMTPTEFAQWYRDPQNYRPELPSTNRGHQHE